jgi:hypothetical protein
MELDAVHKLQPGDEVYWNDPNEGTASRVWQIQRIEIFGELVVIHDPQGDTLECFASELS